MQGVVVARVEPGSAAERAGLRAGDIVTAVDGVPVRSAADFRNRVGLAETGSELEIAYLRGGQRRTATVRVEAELRGRGPGSRPLAGATLHRHPRGAPGLRPGRGRHRRPRGARQPGRRRRLCGRGHHHRRSMANRSPRRRSSVSALAGPGSRIALNLLRGEVQFLIVIE